MEAMDGAYVIDAHRVSRAAATLPPLNVRWVRWALRDVLRDFSRTQRLTVYEQLVAGARFLDIRVSKLTPAAQDERLWVVHGAAACVPLADIISQINAFHDQSPKRAHVILAVRHFRLSPAEASALAAQLNTELTHPLFRGDADALAVTPLDELPVNVVAGVAGVSKLSAGWAVDDWINTYCGERKLAGLHGQLSSAVRQASAESSLSYIAMRIVSVGRVRPSLITEASRFNARLAPFLADHAPTVAAVVDVLFFDFFSPAIAAAIGRVQHVVLGARANVHVTRRGLGRRLASTAATFAAGAAVGVTVVALPRATARYRDAADIPSTAFPAAAAAAAGSGGHGGTTRGAVLSAFVTDVADGDTLRVRHTPLRPPGSVANDPSTYFARRALPRSDPDALPRGAEETLPVRLAGVDCPEVEHFGKPGQPLGEEAKAFVADLLYGRLVATLWVGPPWAAVNVSAALLGAGLAVIYRGAGAVDGGWGAEYERLEADAKARGVGVWGAAGGGESPSEFKARMRAGG
ncbi:hypothetical protein I4F81_006679 [Pyropia yezoensis]|uniref:Uncharacterized protein n=1 Tax=Pyropia yezoensis TaxID=2788 RepID=A0ACC3C2F4_PYRYE|nr:hypothetical protein I4F81_006679 [Neopyropia yezoensis]